MTLVVTVQIELDDDDLLAINCHRAGEGDDWDGETKADPQEASEHLEGVAEGALEDAHRSLENYRSEG